MKLTIMIGLYVTLNLLVIYLTDLCLRRWERTGKKASKHRCFWLLPYLLCALLPVAGTFLPEGSLKFSLQAAGNLWLGFWMYYSTGLLILLAVRGIGGFLAGLRYRGQWERREHIGTVWYGRVLCLAMVVSVALCGYGLLHAQKTRVVTYNLAVDKQAEGRHPLKVVLIADLHLSVNSRPALTEHTVELINRESPDVVVVAGDVFTSSYKALAHPEQYSRALRRIRAPYGVYAVYGNHDVEEALFGGFAVASPQEAYRSERMENFFRECGFVPLEDQMITLPGGVQLAGRQDGMKTGHSPNKRAGARALLAKAKQDRPIIVLEHEPREFQQLAEAGADLILCGHTHDGQLFPGNLIVPFSNENGWGYKRMYGTDTIVTAGVGYYGPPMRIATDSEVTVINIAFQS